MMNFAAKMGVLLLNLLAVALVVYSVALALNSNFNMGNLMIWLLTVAVGVYAIWREPLQAWFSAGVGHVVFLVLAVLVGIYALVVGFVAVSGSRATVTGQEKVIIVLGAGLRGDQPSNLLRCRLDKALAYAQEHPELLVITTGGQGRDEWVPEGQAMRDYLIAHGLALERVLAETRSTSTEENFAFALDILREQGMDADAPMVYVTNGFHSYRAGRYAERAGFTAVTSLPSAVPLTAALPCFLREALALCYYCVFKTSASGPMHAMVGILDLNKRFFYRGH